MSKKEKLLTKILNAPNDVRYNELIRLMEYFGCTVKETMEGCAFLH